MEKDPLSYEWLTYAWVIALSGWGGAASYLGKIKKGRSFSFAELVGELCISGFVGVLTFYLCQAAEIPPPFAAFLVGVAGHMGSRSLYLFEMFVTKKFFKDASNTTNKP